jgi:hypothetical protein
LCALTPQLRLTHPRPTCALLDLLYFDGHGRSSSPTPMPVRPIQLVGLSASMNSMVRRELFVHGWSRAPEVVRTSSTMPAAITHTYVKCDEDNLLEILSTGLRVLPVSSAIVFVPPTVRISAIIELLASVDIAARAVCEHVTKGAVPDMTRERGLLADFLAGGVAGKPAVVVATTEAVRSCNLVATMYS